MERLTVSGVNIGFLDSSKLPSYEFIYEKLRKYEDVEEQGLLLKLPCKVGDKICRFWYVDNVPYRVQMQTIKTLSNLVAIMESGELGKTVFLAQAEAEEKLKGVKQ